MVLDVPPRVALSPLRRCSSRSRSRAALLRIAAPLQAPVAKIVIARLTGAGYGTGAALAILLAHRQTLHEYITS